MDCTEYDFLPTLHYTVPSLRPRAKTGQEIHDQLFVASILPIFLFISKQLPPRSHHASQCQDRYVQRLSHRLFHSQIPPAISTSKVLLVPYSKWHVPRYHEWMKDPVWRHLILLLSYTIHETTTSI